MLRAIFAYRSVAVNNVLIQYLVSHQEPKRCQSTLIMQPPFFRTPQASTNWFDLFA